MAIRATYLVQLFQHDAERLVARRLIDAPSAAEAIATARAAVPDVAGAWPYELTLNAETNAVVTVTALGASAMCRTGSSNP